MPTKAQKRQRTRAKLAAKKGQKLSRREVAELRKDRRTMTDNQLGRKWRRHIRVLEAYIKGDFDE